MKLDALYQHDGRWRNPNQVSADLKGNHVALISASGDTSVYHDNDNGDNNKNLRSVSIKLLEAK